jgi:hypothetical protein
VLETFPGHRPRQQQQRDRRSSQVSKHGNHIPPALADVEKLIQASPYNSYVLEDFIAALPLDGLRPSEQQGLRQPWTSTQAPPVMVRPAQPRHRKYSPW